MNMKVSAFYGLAIIASGMLRYFGEPGGHTGLWFGIVFGTLSLIAAFCFSKSRQRLGMSLMWVSVLFVGGWFFYEAVIKKGVMNAEPRLLVMIILSIAVAVLTILGGKSKQANVNAG
jgi:hypothetical protein